MTDQPLRPTGAAATDPRATRKPLPAAAQRALAEAAERRAQAEREAAAARGPASAAAKEIQGPKGPEPTRYGDWERKGIASDF